MSADDFYLKLKPFLHFEELTSHAHYQSVPDDWVIVIADVVNSTAAIEAGQYKDVNTIGAACIVAAKNAAKQRELPFVFGGDGATLLMPQSQWDTLKQEFSALSNLSRDCFQLELRIGVIPIKTIRGQQQDVEVAKFELTAGTCLAFMRGGGITLADQLIKRPDSKYLFTGNDDQSPDLQGLSCRWKAIPSRNGVVVAILVQARGTDQQQVYQHTLKAIKEILGDDLDSANPVNSDLMAYKSAKECRQEERKLHRKWFSLAGLRRLLEICIAVSIFKRGIPTVVFNAEKYKQSLATHSDYRKFDDTLRMIVDCSSEQSRLLAAQFETLRRDNKIYYGLNESPASRITCFFESAANGGHMHFVDGNNGGYASAARQLKSQIDAT